MDLMAYLARVRDGRPHDADGYQPGALYRITLSDSRARSMLLGVN